jgi:hypothetical protein
MLDVVAIAGRLASGIDLQAGHKGGVLRTRLPLLKDLEDPKQVSAD